MTDKKSKLTRILYVIPFMIPLILFWIIPLITAFGISFTDWDYISPNMTFVGVENYTDLLTDSDFKKALLNTLIFGLGTIIPTIVFGLLLALFFQKKFKGSKLYQLIIFSPWVTPTVAVSLVWSWIYEPDRGIANHILNFIGLNGIQWLHSSETAMLGIIIFTIWKSVGYTMIFYISALERVPRSLYEASEIDGANKFKQFTNITIPLISPTTFFLFIINLIQSIQVYDQIQIMTQGGPGSSTTTLLYLYYNKAFQNFQMGSANAVAMVILLIIVVLSLLSMKIGDRFTHYE